MNIPIFTITDSILTFSISGTFWPACRSIGAGRFGRFDVMKKMNQYLCRHCGIEEANVGIALATARLDNEKMVHFLPQDLCRCSGKSAKIKRAGYYQEAEFNVLVM